jgi:hypothetical protein
VFAVSAFECLRKSREEIREDARERFDSTRLRVAYYVVQRAIYDHGVQTVVLGVLLTLWLLIGHGIAVWLYQTFPSVPWESGTRTVGTYALILFFVLLLVAGAYEKYRKLVWELSEEGSA